MIIAKQTLQGNDNRETKNDRRGENISGTPMDKPTKNTQNKNPKQIVAKNHLTIRFKEKLRHFLRDEKIVNPPFIFVN